MEELCQYDPNMVVGVMGGGSGTTYDAFKLIHDAQKYGARAALFGRKINHAEHQPAFIEMLRLVTDGRIAPEEAVRAYHGVLQACGIKPRRNLAEDLTLTEPTLRGGGSAGSRGAKADPSAHRAAASTGAGDWPKRADGTPDFDRMSSRERLTYDQARLTRRFG
jgi:hypothetical protein